MGVFRRLEGAGLELRLAAEAAIEPDRELPGDLQRVEGVAMITEILVGGAVPGDADLVEQVEDLAGRGPLEFQAA